VGSLNNFAHTQNSVAQLSGIHRNTSTIEEARCIFATNLTQSAALTAADATVRRRANIGRKKFDVFDPDGQSLDAFWLKPRHQSGTNAPCVISFKSAVSSKLNGRSNVTDKQPA
jgi:hypothetical protein